MSNDELVWQIIGYQFCSFRAKVADNERDFCRNEHNVTGLCDRRSCPLANSRYATVREEDGRAVLYVKTVERAHMPNRLWEKTVLPQNYAQALAIIDRELAFWPKWLVLKNKQRLTKIHQLFIRMRKLRKEKNTPLLVRIDKKDERREKKREAKALDAAKLELSIEKELLERLKQGTYGGIYNYPAPAYEKALRDAEAEFEEEQEEEEDEARVEFVEGDFSDDDEDDMEDWDDGANFGEEEDSEDAQSDEDDDASRGRKKTKVSADEDDVVAKGVPRKPANKPTKPAAAGKRGPYIEIEYENEEEEAPLKAQSSSSSSW